MLYRGANGFVAHECIIDAGQFKKTAGVSVEDIAKRLADFGYHAPTVSWPEPGAIMIEPTESESKYELDKFCDAMLAIEKEIARIAAGEWPRENNPLVCAPHVAEDVLAMIGIVRIVGKRRFIRWRGCVATNTGRRYRA